MMNFYVVSTMQQKPNCITCHNKSAQCRVIGGSCCIQKFLACKWSSFFLFCSDHVNLKNYTPMLRHTSTQFRSYRDFKVKIIL